MLRDVMVKASEAAPRNLKAADLYEKALTAYFNGRLGEANRFANAAISAGK